MINTFLFDLDGTLLPMDGEVFEREYFKRLALKLKDYFPPELLIKHIWKSTARMVMNTGGKKTNKEVFFEDFISSTGKDIETLGPVFDEFYNREFKELGKLVKPEQYVVKAIDTLIEKGYDVVVATNPIFPMAAIEERIRWAGLNKNVFKYITCFENMHYCKPNIEFYGEVLDIIGKTPDECMMVGNDVQEDLVSSNLGIKTFLVEDHMINSKGEEPKPDYRGSYRELYELVAKGLPPVKKAV